MRIFILLVIGGTLWLLINGFGELKLALQNSASESLTIDQFNQSPRSSGWFRITDGVMNLTDAMYMRTEHKILPDSMFRKSDRENIEEVYIPIRSRTASENTTTALLLKTSDQAIIATVQMISDSVEAIQSEEEAISFLANHRDEIFLTEPVEGLTEYGSDEMESMTRNSARTMDASLAEGFVVLNHNDRPSLVGGIVKCCLGLAIPTLVVFGFLARRKDEDQLPEDDDRREKEVGESDRIETL